MKITTIQFSRLFILLGALVLSLFWTSSALAQANMYGFPPVTDPPIFCGKTENLSCPVEMLPIYEELNTEYSSGDECATGSADFLTDPKTKHYWVEDPDITAQGKADERARQFLYWVLTTNAIDSAPVLASVWQLTSVIALFGVVLIAAIFGIGYIISQRTNYDFKIRIWPTIIKIGTMLLYVAFSSAIVFVLIQFSEIMMKFFYENLGGKELFNIYFVDEDPNVIGSTEASYRGFIGCRDLNIRVQEGIDAEIFMLKLTNVSYYVMGVMLLLRKILLWFLLFVSPFLALLMPFILIRNTGWIWIGVFFQWLFYGPLLTLFLGGMARIWNEGIPFGFDFSRVEKIAGYVYPTGINIVYGGPAQRASEQFNRPISALNNASYVDTFVEYIITLIMLWAVTFFPWWLLRIFRDMCCDGIYAMKNILLAMYDNMRGGPSKGPSPTGPGIMPSLKLDLPTSTPTTVNISLSSIDQIRKTLTQDLTKNLSLSATKITDIARVETNKQTNQTVVQNISYLSNPVQASKPAERQQYMNLRSELFARAIKSDQMARTILASTSTSTEEKVRIREQLVKSMPQTLSVTQVLSNQSHVSNEAVTTITNAYTSSISNNNSAVQQIAKTMNAPVQAVTNILNTYKQITNQPIAKIVSTLAKETNTTIQTVKEVLRQAGAISTQSRILQEVASSRHIEKNQVTKIIQSIRQAVTQKESVVTSISQQSVTKETVSRLMSEVSQHKDTIQKVSVATQTTPQTVQSVLTSYSNQIQNNPQTLIQNVAQETHTDTKIVRTIINQVANQINNSSETQQSLAQSTNTSVQHIQALTTAMENATSNVSEQTVASTITQELQAVPQLTEERVTQTIQTICSDENIINQVSAVTTIDASQVKAISQSYVSHMNEAPTTLVTSVQNDTKNSVENIQKVIQTIASVVSSNTTVSQGVAQTTQGTQEQITTISNAMYESVVTNNTAQSQESLVKQVSQKTNISEIESQQIIQNLMTTASQNESFVQNISHQTNLKTQQVKNIMNTYASHIQKPNEEIVRVINESSGIPKADVQNVLIMLSDGILQSDQIVSDVAHEQGVDANQVSAVMEQQMEIASDPEKHIEKTISIPQSISLEDYEEVKDMWTKHYEEGEVPVSETIQSRDDWIDQEIVYITNTLNKILSPDERLQQEGLDELGYLLPIFLINNLKGDELIVYLKAKLEAAKLTQKILAREAKATEKAKKESDEDEEVFVDVAQKEEEKSDMHMDLEEDQPAPQSIEDRVKAVQEKLAQVEAGGESPQDSVSGIHEKLQEEAGK